jgi:hypothetical protein
MTLPEYITELNQTHYAGRLTTDLGHWAKYGVTTAEGLKTHLEECEAEEDNYIRTLGENEAAYYRAEDSSAWHDQIK